MFPKWKDSCEDGRLSWTTRLESTAFGVVAVLVPEMKNYPGFPRDHIYVEIVMLDPLDDWSAPPIAEKWVETWDEALHVAADYRERLETYAAVAVLQ
jgi:hypothetical protein